MSSPMKEPNCDVFSPLKKGANEPLPTVVASAYAYSNSSSNPSPPRMPADDSDNSPLTPAPKRTRYSSDYHHDMDEGEGDRSESPIYDLSIDSDVSPLLSSSSSDESSGFETDDSATDFEAADIKWSYEDTVFAVADYAYDIYDTWRNSERSFTSQFLSAQPEISEEVRKTVLLNVLSLRRNMGIAHETIHLAVFLLDKCLDTFKVSAEIFRDLSAVCLVIASKVEDVAPLKLSDVICMEITERDLDADDKADKLKAISRLEKRILSELEYRLTFVTPFMFMNIFHQHLRSCLYTIQLSNYILELCLLSTKYRDFGGAFTAHAVICLAKAIVSSPDTQEALAQLGIVMILDHSRTRGIWYILELCLLSTKYRDFGGAFTAHAVICLAKAIVSSPDTQEALALIEETENTLAGPCRIPVGHTRSIMRLLLDDMQKASDDQNWVWIEYNSDDRCSVSSFSVPNGLGDVLASPPTEN